MAVEGNTEIAGIRVAVCGDELIFYQPNGEGFSEFITEETISRLHFLNKLVEANFKPKPGVLPSKRRFKWQT